MQVSESSALNNLATDPCLHRGPQWMESLHNPCLLGGPQEWDRIRSGYINLASQGPTCGRNGYITPAFSGIPKAGTRTKCRRITRHIVLVTEALCQDQAPQDLGGCRNPPAPPQKGEVRPPPLSRGRSHLNGPG